MAAGIINPVTGRRHVTVWKADEIIPFAVEAYTKLGNELGIQAISQKDILYFFPSVQMRESFLERVEDKGSYISHQPDDGQWRKYFHYEFDLGEIIPAYTVHLENLLPAWREALKKKNLLYEENFDQADLKIHPGKIEYRDITAGKIIFCDGLNSFIYPLFDKLPFAPNKGQALILEIPDLPGKNLYKKNMILTPLQRTGVWWFGSNYEWEFEHDQPTENFRKQAESYLRQWLRLPYKITDHICAVRPATLERRPFVGMHPQYDAVAILNGMGSKGCSLAPYFAKQLVENLLYQKPIEPGADIRRFEKMLNR